MKKEVLLVTILVIIVSLSAVVYAAALTNPGHGVEQVGSGSSPYAPFRDWNALEVGYEDQYSGPAALKSNIFWLATSNAETIAAQNSSGDWCAFQVHPSGIYMNCFNNASNMSLYNSYYWNGTNFTKNDTIKNGSNVIEKKVLTVGSGGGSETFSITGGSGIVTRTTIATPGSTSATTTVANTGGAVSTATTTPIVIKLENLDVGTSTVEIDGGAGVTTSADNGAGSIGTSTVTPTGTSTGQTSGGTPVGGELGGDLGSGAFLINYDTAGTNAILSQLNLFENVEGGTYTQSIIDIVTGNAGVTITEVIDNAGGGNFQTVVASDDANPLPSTTIINFNGPDNIYGTQTAVADSGSAATGTISAGISGGSGGEPVIALGGTDSTGAQTAEVNIEPGTGSGQVSIDAPSILNIDTLGIAATTYFSTYYDSEILWISGVEFACPGENDFLTITSQAPDGESVDGIALSGGPGSGCWTISTAPLGIGTGFTLCGVLNNR